MTIPQILYRASAKATGGREGRAISSDHVLDVKLTRPKGLGGAGEVGSNPEQLFAAGYSACFIGAMKFVGGRDNIAVPADATVDATVGIGPVPTGFAIEVELKIALPGMARDQAEKLVAATHIVCPYSNATRGNIDVTLTLV